MIQYIGIKKAISPAECENKFRYQVMIDIVVFYIRSLICHELISDRHRVYQMYYLVVLKLLHDKIPHPQKPQHQKYKQSTTIFTRFGTVEQRQNILHFLAQSTLLLTDNIYIVYDICTSKYQIRLWSL